ncbi:MBL fold metallo-hydrolase [soil metagenome]
MLQISCYTGGMAQTNGYLVESANGNFIVDAPEGMAGWLSRKSKKVSAILLTHQHFDHVQDAAAIKKEHEAKIYAHSPFARELTLEFLMGFVSGTRFEVEAFEVDELLEGKEELEVLGASWQLAHIPGHSVDSITFYQSMEKLVFGGDVLFQGSIGRTDFPNGSLEQLLQGIEIHMLTLPDDTRVLPGHGPGTTIGEERLENEYLAG